MAKMYLIKFDTQKDRVYRNWEYWTIADSKKKAIEAARFDWYEFLQRKSHMFHCEAIKVTYNPDIEQNQFNCIGCRQVTWGNVNR